MKRDIKTQQDTSLPDSALRDSDYRPDIDGLRCVAVLSVVFFHLGFKSFGGGWVGVDVFFVISGFLITRLIRDEVDRQSFSFSGFYTRRARRLFPAFFFTVAVTFLVGTVVFDPIYRQHFAGETVYALAAASNFFYWLDGGYFGIAEEYKPLLHTWSLGVEEQFYLLWPPAITLMRRHRPQWVRPVLVTAFVGSLMMAQLLLYAGRPYLSFFLLPSRIFEFAIGALLVWLPAPTRTGERFRGPALLLGLASIAYSVFRFTIATPFPGLSALIPCGGAVLAIYGGAGKSFRSILGNRLMVDIGKISYSLYLIHWPMIVLFRYHRLAPPTWLDQLAILSCAIAGATLMYHFIEQPFRTGHRPGSSSRAAYGLTCVMLTVLLLIPASILWAKGTLFWKSSVFAMDPAALKLAEEQQYRDDLDRLLENRQFGALSSRLRLMFVGDSHSEDMAAALYLALGVEGYDYASLSLHVPCFSSVDRRPWIVQIADPQSDCRKEISLLKESRSLAEADYVFISNLWDEDTIGGFDEGIALIRSLTNARIVIVGQNAVFPTFDSSLRFLGTERLQKFNRVMFDEQSAIDVQINAQLEKLAATARLDFIDRQELECSAATASCTVVGSDGEFYYLDHNHWSYAGRKVYGEKLLTKYRGMLAQAHKLPPAVVGNRAGAL